MKKNFYAFVWAYGRGGTINGTPAGCAVSFKTKKERDLFVWGCPVVHSQSGHVSSVKAHWIRRQHLEVLTLADYELIHSYL